MGMSPIGLKPPVPFSNKAVSKHPWDDGKSSTCSKAWRSLANASIPWSDNAPSCLGVHPSGAAVRFLNMAATALTCATVILCPINRALV